MKSQNSRKHRMHCRNELFQVHDKRLQQDSSACSWNDSSQCRYFLLEENRLSRDGFKRISFCFSYNRIFLHLDALMLSSSLVFYASHALENLKSPQIDTVNNIWEKNCLLTDGCTFPLNPYQCALVFFFFSQSFSFYCLLVLYLNRESLITIVWRLFLFFVVWGVCKRYHMYIVSVCVIRTTS